MSLYLRSALFNVVFFSYSLLAAVGFSWSFFLPRKHAYKVILWYFANVAWIERIILGLSYEVEGLEHLPPAGTPYILAVKHYSAYETLKVPLIFDNIAIILKRELTWIPFWGWYTLKTGMIPLNRGKGAKAISSLVKNARRAVEQGRPILVFPQGTRVSIHDDTQKRPYKVGVVKIAQGLNLPIVPVALNSGVFWPKHGFIKKPGVVSFEVLPTIPAGLPPLEALKRLEEAIEPACTRLVANAKVSTPRTPRFVMPKAITKALRLLSIFMIAWTLWWGGVFVALHQGINKALVQNPTLQNIARQAGKPVIEGFPFRMQARWGAFGYKNAGDDFELFTPGLEATFWPLPWAQIDFGFAHGAVIKSGGHAFLLTRAMGRAHGRYASQNGPYLKLSQIEVKNAQSALTGMGAIMVPFAQSAPIQGRMDIEINNYKNIIGMAQNAHIINKRTGQMASAFMGTMASAQGRTGAVSVEVKLVDNVVYAGILRLFKIER